MPELRDLLEMFSPDPRWLEETKAWYGKVFRGEPLERLLLSIAGLPPVPQRFDMKEQYENAEAMFYEQLRVMVAAAQARSAALPSLRANLGTGFVASIFGIQQVIFPDKMPWPQGHISKSELSSMRPEDFTDVDGKGLLPKASDIYRFYQSRLGTNRYCYIPDTQGVLDIAHLVRGDELFTDLKDDPGFVHHLLELCLQAYITVTKAMKQVIGEALDSGLHGGIAMFNGGVRYCMDTTVLLSAKDIEEFEVPYLRRALAAFGGGWVHFCGYAPHLVDILAGVPEVRGVNPNYMDNRPYDYERDIRVLHQGGKFFFGAPFKEEKESVSEYFARVLRPLSSCRGLIFTPRGPGLDTSRPRALIDLWNLAQDGVFP